MEYKYLCWYDIPELIVPILIFRDRGLLITRKLQKQGFLLVKWKASLRVFYGHTMTWLTVTEYLFLDHTRREQELFYLLDHMISPRLCSICCFLCRFVDHCVKWLSYNIVFPLTFKVTSDPVLIVDIYIINYIQFFISHTILDTQIHIMIQRLYLSFVLLLVW